MIATNLFVSPGDGGGNSQLVRFVYGAPAYLVPILPVGVTPDLTVDALFERRKLHDLVYGKLAGLFDFTFDRERPWLDDEIFRVFGGIRFAGAKFVIVVVMSDVLYRRFFFGGAARPLGKTREFSGGRTGGWTGQ